jgi:hypothetical protein
MLNLKPYLSEMEELTPGQTVRLDHTDCEAGEDTRQRLYLTRTHADESKVVAYCHNCQQGGAWCTTPYQLYRDDKHDATNAGWIAHVTHKERVDVEEPPGLVSDPYVWPAPAVAWISMQGLNYKMVEKYGIKYDPSTDRVYLPRYRTIDRGAPIEESKLLGYQLRSLQNWNKPKYLTVQSKEGPNYTYIHNGSTNHAVVVEDLASGIAIAEATDYGVYVNYGTKIDPTMMYIIATNFQYAYIWLDNDNHHVIRQSRLMAQTIAMYDDLIDVIRVKTASDPKHYTPDEITGALKGAGNG